jgi:hypothetical protein
MSSLYVSDRVSFVPASYTSTNWEDILLVWREWEASETPTPSEVWEERESEEAYDAFEMGF